MKRNGSSFLDEDEDFKGINNDIMKDIFELELDKGKGHRHILSMHSQAQLSNVGRQTSFGDIQRMRNHQRSNFNRKNNEMRKSVERIKTNNIATTIMKMYHNESTNVQPEITNYDVQEVKESDNIIMRKSRERAQRVSASRNDTKCFSQSRFNPEKKHSVQIGSVERVNSATRQPYNSTKNDRVEERKYQENAIDSGEMPIVQNHYFLNTTKFGLSQINPNFMNDDTNFEETSLFLEKMK